ncbi:hypothetical protein SETIT_1G224800v2 [Setaria italica]|uniref:Uncharacterized protein n=1 Tax=Setaria italica TaxID=4555 RepID=K3YV93_SETIT|nr:uncharacterized protein LOC101759775 [Setaria italica]XP_004953026.1 uncharacterized protein LOC101759775 [Setaria italica]XP_012701903.1 uncharacterized protein LOC101759775 [Setaria italica]RCV07190.1 hypothetical protein SETIT_1G224800v2 [Setaria italica]
MAFTTPAAVLLDENMHIHGGKRADAPRAKPLKPSEKKPGLQERKALQDVSNFAKGTALKDRSVKERSQQRKALQNVTNTIQSKERPTLKEQRSTVKERSDLGKHEVVNPLNILTDEEIKKCHEWAKDGAEGAHFHDYQKSDKDLQDKRVKKKVAKVLSALDGWSNVVYDRVMFPAAEVEKFFEEEKGLELEPEILPDISWGLSHSGDKAKLAEYSFTDDELDQYPSLDNNPVTFELRDEPEIPQLGVY